MSLWMRNAARWLKGEETLRKWYGKARATAMRRSGIVSANGGVSKGCEVMIGIMKPPPEVFAGNVRRQYFRRSNGWAKTNRNKKP